jgi:hypothetical protein
VVTSLAEVLDTTAAHLLGEAAGELLKDPKMLDRLKDISELPEEERKVVLHALDAMLRDAKTRKAYAS